MADAVPLPSPAQTEALLNRLLFFVGFFHVPLVFAQVSHIVRLPMLGYLSPTWLLSTASTV